MTLYLDTEFNGHGGALMSLALVHTSGDYFYRVLPMPGELVPWVAENVVPFLAEKPTQPDSFRANLRGFLERYEGEDIVADWPDDFAHLMQCMSGASYDVSFLVPCRLVLLESGDVRSAIPHNALSDAKALMAWHQAELMKGGQV